jgi:glycosyltransferase involved in cell wall biosynthesis
LFNRKYIPILHGGNLPYRLEKSKFLSRLIFSNSYVNVAPSNYLVRAFSEKGFNNLVFIPNTIEIETLKFSDRDFSTPKLLWVRSFSSIYNPKMAIKVFSELKKEFPNAELCMVGPDKENLLDECKSYAKSLNVDVQFTGKLSKEAWIELSNDYNIFINTTNFDNTPVSVIEAMALGLPVVSTNVGGIPFLLTNNENGLLVAIDDSEAMVEAIKALISSKKLQSKITINARKLVEEFDWNNVKQKWSEILK